MPYELTEIKSTLHASWQHSELFGNQASENQNFVNIATIELDSIDSLSLLRVTNTKHPLKKVLDPPSPQGCLDVHSSEAVELILEWQEGFSEQKRNKPCLYRSKMSISQTLPEEKGTFINGATKVFGRPDRFVPSQDFTGQSKETSLLPSSGLYSFILQNLFFPIDLTQWWIHFQCECDGTNDSFTWSESLHHTSWC